MVGTGKVEVSCMRMRGQDNGYRVGWIDLVGGQYKFLNGVSVNRP